MTCRAHTMSLCAEVSGLHPSSKLMPVRVRTHTPSDRRART